MGWEDTFLSNGKLLEMFGTPDFTERQGREAQAEISFKAGQEDVLLESKMGTITVSSLVNRGRKEVVEWIEDNNTTPLGKDDYGYYVWKAKLLAQVKEWGINNDS